MWPGVDVSHSLWMWPGVDVSQEDPQEVNEGSGLPKGRYIMTIRMRFHSCQPAMDTVEGVTDAGGTHTRHHVTAVRS